MVRECNSNRDPDYERKAIACWWSPVIDTVRDFLWLSIRESDDFAQLRSAELRNDFWKKKVDRVTQYELTEERGQPQVLWPCDWKEVPDFPDQWVWLQLLAFSCCSLFWLASLKHGLAYWKTWRLLLKATRATNPPPRIHHCWTSLVWTSQGQQRLCIILGQHSSSSQAYIDRTLDSYIILYYNLVVLVDWMWRSDLYQRGDCWVFWSVDK